MYSSKTRAIHLGATVLLALLSLSVFSLLGAVQVAHAATVTLNSSTCVSALGGTWSGSTCTMPTSYTAYTVASGNNLEIPSGTTLIIPGNNAVTVDQGGNLTVDSGGNITITIAYQYDDGILNNGNVTNYGTIKIATSWYEDIGIQNLGDLTNYGTIYFVNIGTIGISNGGYMYNHGTFDIETPDSACGVSNLYDGIFINYGLITVDNTGGSQGINNYGTITNAGTITIEDSSHGTFGYGIWNQEGGTITNSGTITVGNSAGTGIENDASVSTITNSGTIDIENSGGTGIENDAVIINTCSGTIIGTVTGNPVQQASGCPPVGAPEFPVPALGPLLIAALLFPALVVMRRRLRVPA